jgi:hypothetical protein
MMDPDTVVIDVRNFNETVLGKFAPAQVLESSGEGGGEYGVWLCAVQYAAGRVGMWWKCGGKCGGSCALSLSTTYLLSVASVGREVG